MRTWVEHRVRNDERIDVCASIAGTLDAHIRGLGVDAAPGSRVADVRIEECVEELRALNRLGRRDGIIELVLNNGFRREHEASRGVIRNTGVEHVIDAIWETAECQRIVHFYIVGARERE